MEWLNLIWCWQSVQSFRIVSINFIFLEFSVLTTILIIYYQIEKLVTFIIYLFFFSAELNFWIRRTRLKIIDPISIHLEIWESNSCLATISVIDIHWNVECVLKQNVDTVVTGHSIHKCGSWLMMNNCLLSSMKWIQN